MIRLWAILIFSFEAPCLCVAGAREGEEEEGMHVKSRLSVGKAVVSAWGGGRVPDTEDESGFGAGHLRLKAARVVGLHPRWTLGHHCRSASRAHHSSDSEKRRVIGRDER